MVAAACGSDAAAETKAAFIYVGPVGDAGWTYAHDQGRQAAAAETGIETAYVETVPEGTADFGNYVREFIDQGFTVIIGTSFGYMDDMEALAEEAAMSLSAFHRHFKAVTNLSPLQYQKQLRLLQARTLLVAAGYGVTRAAHEVGYESPTQFSREYARAFGQPPSKDTARIVAGLRG